MANKKNSSLRGKEYQIAQKEREKEKERERERVRERKANGEEEDEDEVAEYVDFIQIEPTVKWTPSPASRRVVLKDDLQQCTIDVFYPFTITESLTNFPYYLSGTTKNLLITSTYIALQCSNNKVLADLPSSCPRVLLMGPAGSDIYQELLARAIARYHNAKLLVVDWHMLSRVKKDSANKETDEPATLLDETNKDSNVMNKLIKFVIRESLCTPLLVFLKESAKYMTDDCLEAYQSQVDRMPKDVVFMLSYIRPDHQDHANSQNQLLEKLVSLVEKEKRKQTIQPEPSMKVNPMIWNHFPTRISIQIPRDGYLLSVWKEMLNEDNDTLKSQRNIACIRESLDQVGIECTDLDKFCFYDIVLTRKIVEIIIPWVVSHHFMQLSADCGTEADKRLIISKKSIQHGLMLLKGIMKGSTPVELSTCAEVVLNDKATMNEFELQLLAEVTPPSDVGVSFDDIGALEKAKDTLKELIMIPLQRPDLYCKGELAKPCKGILLFGPPGTGKTMLAKAVATEVGANFINISNSTINSKWLGDAEKYAKAIFTLARKIAPSVIFIDEIDSMLGKRKDNEHEAMRRVKNELMMNWDGLRTNNAERVVVLGATNRPFDLDDAILRRLPRRLMVNLPDERNRENILKVIMSNEDLSPSVELDVVANMTEGYSGSDLRNLCVTAAQCPTRELLEREKKEKALALSKNMPAPQLYTSSHVRAISMDDFKIAMGQVSASVSSESQSVKRLLQWNDLYGDGGSRKKENSPVS